MSTSTSANQPNAVLLALQTHTNTPASSYQKGWQLAQHLLELWQQALGQQEMKK